MAVSNSVDLRKREDNMSGTLTTTINIPAGQTMRGVYDTESGETNTVNGPGNFAPSSYTDNGTSIVNARVIGHAIFADGLGANLEFAGYVGSGVSAYLNLNSTIVIDSPKEFHGTIGDMEQTIPREGPFGEYVELKGLASATGYTLSANDLTLTILGPGHSVLDRLHMTTEFGEGLASATGAVNLDGGNVYLAFGYGIYREPGGIGAETPLPKV
jgi:hypothetical protein